LANVWHELHDFVGVLEEMRRILSPHGRLAVLDWRPDVDRPPGPPIEHRVSPSNVVETLRANHWQAQPALPFGRYNYLITATPRRRDPVS
jgi:SAM-dependent methyltransferase